MPKKEGVPCMFTTERLSLSKNRSDEARVVTEFELIWKQWAEAPSGERKITTFCACHFITKGTTPSKSGLLEKAEVPFLKVYNIVQNQLDFAYRPIFVARETHEKALARSKVFPNDVIMNIVGPPLGKVAIVTDEYPEWNINQALAFFRPLAAFSSSYIAIMLKAPNSLKEILGETRGTVGQDNLSLEQVRSISFPFMPLAEQHCIVAKVDALMALCDQLEASLTTTATTRSKLLNALLHEALSPNAEAAQ
jgi:type I restriction enzyme S subunit